MCDRLLIITEAAAASCLRVRASLGSGSAAAVMAHRAVTMFLGAGPAATCAATGHRHMCLPCVRQTRRPRALKQLWHNWLRTSRIRCLSGWRPGRKILLRGRRNSPPKRRHWLLRRRSLALRARGGDVDSGGVSRSVRAASDPILHGARPVGARRQQSRARRLWPRRPGRGHALVEGG